MIYEVDVLSTTFQTLTRYKILIYLREIKHQFCHFKSVGCVALIELNSLVSVGLTEVFGGLRN